MPFGNPILSGSTLNRTSMQSEDFVTGVSGWAIYRDGSAEFNNVVVRGTVNVTGVNNSYVRIENQTVDQAQIEFYPGDNTTQPVLAPGYVKANNLSFGGGGVSQMIIRTPSYTGGDAGTALMFLSSERPDAPTSQAALFLRGDPPYSDGGNPFQLFVEGEILCEGDLEVDRNLTVYGIGSVRYQEVGTVSVTNSTALVDVPSSSITFDPLSTYWVESWIAYDGPVAGDARFAWAVSHVDLGADRNIHALAAGTADNASTLVTMIRRGTATQQIVGTPAGVTNGFSLYHEVAIVKNVNAAAQTGKLQFAQGTANATLSKVQSGYQLIRRVA